MSSLPGRDVRHQLAVLCLAAAAWGCSSKGGSTSTADAATLIFPQDFRQAGFQEVRACRSPGEHSALNGFTVWADSASAGQYDALLSRADAGATEMPAGATVIKEIYQDSDCTSVERWVAMKKIPGFDPAHGDWTWQEVTAPGTVTVEGAVAACYDCHTGRSDGTCIGYGAVNGMDYLCTAP